MAIQSHAVNRTHAQKTTRSLGEKPIWEAPGIASGAVLLVQEHQMGTSNVAFHEITKHSSNIVSKA